MNGTLVPGITEQILAIPEATFNKMYKIMFSPLHTTSHNNVCNAVCSNALFYCLSSINLPTMYRQRHTKKQLLSSEA